MLRKDSVEFWLGVDMVFDFWAIFGLIFLTDLGINFCDQKPASKCILIVFQHSEVVNLTVGDCYIALSKLYSQDCRAAPPPLS